MTQWINAKVLIVASIPGVLFEKKIKTVNEYLYPIKPNSLHLPHKGLNRKNN